MSDLLVRCLKREHTRFVQDHVYRDYIVAVFPAGHALAGLRKISLQQMANEDWVFLSRSTEPEMVDDFTTLCANAGFSPRIVSTPLSISAVLVMVAAGVGVTIVPGCVRSFHQPGLKYIRIQPAPPPMHSVATRVAGEPSPTLVAFLNVLRQQLPRIRTQYAPR
jgi:DNA-binding transcriptional LysR family regulator